MNKMIPIGAEGATSAGGGISTTAGSATITDSVINSNQVNFTGTALGGGIDCGPRKKTPAEIMSDIAVMPMESSPGGFSGEDHDQVLYGGDEPR